jgi:hypothetical protein
MLGFNAHKKLFAALLALPNMAAAFSSTSLLFLPGALWNKDQRLVSSMGQVPSPSLPFPSLPFPSLPFPSLRLPNLSNASFSPLLTKLKSKGRNCNNVGHYLHAQPHRNKHL